MKRITGARIVTPNGVIDGDVVYGEKIISVGSACAGEAETELEANGDYLIPGLIDLHIHGYLGSDATDGDARGLEIISRGILKNGVTAFLPTTMTASYETLEKAFSAIRGAMNALPDDCAEVLGAHAEGPFINESRKGAQAGEHIRRPDADFVIKHKDVIKLITLAPEKDEGLGAIKRICAETDAVVSMGHTDMDYETAMRAIDAGVSHATHLFNAMTPITHRSPGAAGAALFSDKVSCELICDRFHIDPALFMPVFKLKGKKFNLITDCIRAGGLTDGEYDLGGQNVTVNGVQCRLSDGTIAGSILTLNKAVFNLASVGVPLHEAVNAASLYPATVLGLENERGAIAEGLKADMVLCDREMNVKRVIRNGKTVYRA